MARTRALRRRRLRRTTPAWASEGISTAEPPAQEVTGGAAALAAAAAVLAAAAAVMVAAVVAASNLAEAARAEARVMTLRS